MEKDLRDCMMSAYDQAGDGRIAMREVRDHLSDYIFIIFIPVRLSFERVLNPKTGG